MTPPMGQARRAPTVTPMTRRLGAIATLALLAVSISALSAPPAHAASARIAASPALSAGTGQVVAHAKGITHTGAITVTFGTETTTRTQIRCDRTKARRTPDRCGILARHTFTTPGRHTVTIKAGKRVLARKTVTVAPTPSSPEPTPAPTGPTTIEQLLGGAWPSEMLALVNSERAKAGRAPLNTCRTLETAAKAHAQDMARRGYYEHTSPEGAQPWDRGAAAGYGTNVYYGENIALGQMSVPEVVTAWVNSAGHYSNIVNANYTHAGFAVAQAANGNVYWVQNFGAGGTCG